MIQKEQTQICKCGHLEKHHDDNEAEVYGWSCNQLNCPCKKFEPQSLPYKTYTDPKLENQSQKMSSSKTTDEIDRKVASGSDTLRGIFSTEDLEKEIKEEVNSRNIYGYIPKGYINDKIEEVVRLTSQRLRSEVEKVIDELVLYSEDGDSHYEWLYVQELKKRLGI